MAAPEYEVRVPGPDNVGHSEVEWRESDDMVHVKKFTDRYECFWYTDAERGDFIANVLDYGGGSTSAGQAPEAFITKVVTEDSETLSEDEIANLSEQSDLSSYEFIEAELDDAKAYWKEETPLRDDLPDYSQLIHVSGTLSAVDPLAYLFRHLAPDRMGGNTRGDMMATVVEYIKMPPGSDG